MTRTHMNALAAGFALSAFCCLSNAATITVLAGDSIQDAIDAASPGDVIELMPGIYTELIRIDTKPLTIRSTDPDDPAVVNATEINGDDLGTVIEIVGPAVNGTKIEGITIRDGRAAQGGGLFIEDVNDVVLRNVDMRSNKTSAEGAGIYSSESNVTATGLWMNNNDSEPGAPTSGGGLYCSGGTMVIKDSDFLSCDTNEYGGAMLLTDGAVVEIVRCEMWNNESARGGAIALTDGAVLNISRTILRGNDALELGGGAIHCRQFCELNLSNCELRDNTAVSSGGAILSRSAATAVNCTIVGNVPEAVWSLKDPVEIDNSIVWDNGASQFLGNVVCTYSNVQGSFPGTGNIDVDPLFTDAAGNNYSLQAGSPSIDAGNSTLFTGSLVDLAGNPRGADAVEPDTGYSFDGPVIDMGAYERQLDDPCPGDVDGNGFIDISDLLTVLAGWGECL